CLVAARSSSAHPRVASISASVVPLALTTIVAPSSDLTDVFPPPPCTQSGSAPATREMRINSSRSDSATSGLLETPARGAAGPWRSTRYCLLRLSRVADVIVAGEALTHELDVGELCGGEVLLARTLGDGVGGPAEFGAALGVLGSLDQIPVL